MIGRLAIAKSAIVCVLAMPMALLAQRPSVEVEAPNLQGSRPVEELTRTAVIRDYMQSWHSLRIAMAQNRPDLLDQDFVGTARDKLGDTIRDQAKIGMNTHYRDRSHRLQIIFYSPEGQSLQLTDTVEYDEQVFVRGKILTTQSVRARYIVVLTPAAARWRVRIFQSTPME